MPVPHALCLLVRGQVEYVHQEDVLAFLQSEDRREEEEEVGGAGAGYLSPEADGSQGGTGSQAATAKQPQPRLATLVKGVSDSWRLWTKQSLVLAAGSGGRVEGNVQATEPMPAKATETMAASLARTIMVCASYPALLLHSTPPGLHVRSLSCACTQSLVPCASGPLQPPACVARRIVKSRFCPPHVTHAIVHSCRTCLHGMSVCCGSYLESLSGSRVVTSVNVKL